MESKNHGRPFRLPKFDYSETGCYFITFCTKGRLPLLSRVIVGRGLAPGSPCEASVELTQIGALLAEQISDLERRFPLCVEHAVIMPNHCHLLITLPGASPRPTTIQKFTSSSDFGGEVPGASPRPTKTASPPLAKTASPPPTTEANPRPTVPSIVGALKSLTTRLANQADGTPGRVLFQTSFHDHVVRDEADFLRHWSYIDGNPGTWAEDEYYCD